MSNVKVEVPARIFIFIMCFQNNALDDDVADIDLTDPDLSKAAVKIQASFRGHMARKEHDK